MQLNFTKLLIGVMGILLFVNASASQIDWQSWHEKAFQKALQDNKLILLDVGTEWCSACNQMQHETYTNPGVQAYINEHFMAIHVDAEAEPDIGERYGFWGWPALIFIAPDGKHIGFYRGFRPADGFMTILQHINSNFQNGTLEIPDIEVDLRSSPSNEEFTELVSLGNQMLDRFYDQQHSGWGGARMADAYLLEQAWWRGAHSSQQHWADEALKSSKQYLKLVDPVWGGVWFGTRSEDFSKDFIHEKRTEHQAGALRIFARAYKNDKDTLWLDALNAVDNYLESFMLSETGGYFTSQEMHIYNSQTQISPQAYFDLDDSQRRATGMPEIDRTAYSDINAKLVIAYKEVFEATGDQHWRQRALSLMTQLKDTAQHDGRYNQILSSDNDVERARVLPADNNVITFLRSQAFTGLASLAAFELSGHQQWLSHAHDIAEVIISDLYEVESGGLLGSSRQQSGPGGLKLADQPLIDNAAAADFFNQLSAYSYGEFDQIGTYSAKQYNDYAQKVLRSVAQPGRLRVQGNFIGQYVLALHQWHDEFAQVSVVCSKPADASCKSLHDTALVKLQHPRRIVKVQQPGYYPERGPANLFICNSKTCSSPIAHDDEELIDKSQRWFAILDGDLQNSNQTSAPANINTQK